MTQNVGLTQRKGVGVLHRWKTSEVTESLTLTSRSEHHRTSSTPLKRKKYKGTSTLHSELDYRLRRPSKVLLKESRFTNGKDCEHCFHKELSIKEIRHD